MYQLKLDLTLAISYISTKILLNIARNKVHFKPSVLQFSFRNIAQHNITVNCSKTRMLNFIDFQNSVRHFENKLLHMLMRCSAYNIQINFCLAIHAKGMDASA